MIDELKKLIEECTSLEELKALLENYQPYDIAEVINELDDENQKKIFEIYTEEELAEILSYQEEEDTAEILEDLPVEVAAAIINEMEPDDASDVLEELGDEKSEALIDLLDEDVQEDIEKLSSYEEDTAGALMTPNFLYIFSGTDVKNAMKIVTKYAPEAEMIDTLFVVDEEKKLLGVLSLKALICARMPKTVNDIMLENFAFVDVNDDYDTIVKKVRDYAVRALPVLEDEKMVGIVTMDDAFDASNEVAEEDYAKFAGLTEDEEKEESIFGSVKKRIPWLAVLMVLDIFIAMIISIFDELISQVVVLTFFQAAILGLAGNCGTQCLAVTVRRIGNGELDEKGMERKHIVREITQGALTGLILSIASFIFVFALLSINKGMLATTTLVTATPIRVAVSVSAAILAAVILSNVSGSIMPIFFNRIHIDPAVASGPFITTLNDVIAVLSYFGVAMLILGI